MGKGIILRVLDGTILSPALSRKLGELLPDYTLETFHAKPDYQDSIRRRIKSLHDAFLFTLDAYPLDPKFTNLTKETLKNYAAELMSECDLEQDSVEESHKELEQFSAKLINVLMIAWQWPKDAALKESIACLNEAEQYLLMSQGRPDTATLTKMDFGAGTEFVVQLDEAIPAYDEQFLTEMRTIKHEGFPKTPAWYRDLTEAQQTYLANFNLGEATPGAIIADLTSFLTDWQKIKATSLDRHNDLQQIFNQTLPLPAWFNKLSKPLKAMIQMSAVSSDAVETVVNTFKELIDEKGRKSGFKSSLDQVLQMPQWYLTLPLRQQLFLEHVVKDAAKIEDAVSYLSSRHRTLPIPANFAAHSLIRIDDKGEASFLSAKRYRSSHIVSRDLLHGRFPRAVHHRHSDANLAKVTEFATEGQKIVLQTLISPIRLGDYVPKMVTDLLPELPPDLHLYNSARDAVTRSRLAKRIFQHNHPYNVAKYYYYTLATNEDSLALLASTQKIVNTIKITQEQITAWEKEIAALEKLELPLQKGLPVLQEQLLALKAKLPGFAPKVAVLQELCNHYKDVLESALGSATYADYNGRELFLSSLEQLIILAQDGYSYGSCVSGKDRKAIELMHTDAMFLYKELYGEWPQFGATTEKRARFVAIVADLYLSRHQHVLAGYNAPGSEGIKTPGWYLPADICEEINRRLGDAAGLVRDDLLASDNEVKKIQNSVSLSSKLIPFSRLSAHLITKQLGERLCTQLYDALTNLINETPRFKVPSKAHSIIGTMIVPTGINLIKAVMDDEHAGKTNVARLAKIIEIVLKRPVEDSSRSPATISVYKGLRNLCIPLVVGASAEDIARDVVSDWELRFKASKLENNRSASPEKHPVVSASL